MKKKIFIIMILVLIVFGIVMFAIDMNRMKNNKPVVFSTWGYKYAPPILESEILEETTKDVVIIKNNEIQNEYLIDEFIEKTDCSKIESQELNILQDDKKIKITYTSGEYAKIYTKKYDLIYRQRKDLGIKEVFDVGDYKIKTFGGDVTITIDSDIVYSLEDALKQKVIMPDDIIAQAKMDVKYGICNQGMYSDGGSVEYCYYGEPENQYTILKLNTLDNEKDLIIGMGGQILSSYNKNK